MNRVARRGGIVLIIAFLLLGGFGFFVVEFFMNSHTWVEQKGSPHVYHSSSKGLTSMVIIDHNDTILLDTRDGTKYSNSEDIRKATVHWVGDRAGNIDVRTLSQFTDELAKIRLEEYNVVSGVYSYGDYTSVAKLTLDAQLQTVALNALGSYNGTVAVYNYKTGEILCAVSSPSFDPDNVPEDIEESYDTAYYNKFIDYTYAPGSIFKIVTTAAALETVMEIEQWSFDCSALYDVPGYDVTCEMAHGHQNLKDAFRNSCNCAFAALSQEIGSDVLAQYAQKLGVAGSITIDGITTASGNYELTQTPSDLAWSAVGQHTVEIVPAAFLNLVGTIANGGQGVAPYIVEEILVRDEPIYTAKTTDSERLISEETASILQEYMRNNVENKYGDEYFPGLTVCAKTGTAEVGTEEDDLDPNAMLTGFVADEEYPLAFIVCVEDAGYGRTVCIPIISEVLAYCKDVMDQS